MKTPEIISRTLLLLKMRRRANTLGIPFTRRANFKIPESVRVSGKNILLNLPDEEGIWNDFIAILLADTYRLAQIDEPIKSILDVGGNVGLFSMAARQHFPQALIHLYEPNVDLKAHLDTQCKQLNFDCYYEGIGATEGFITLEDRGDSNQSRSHRNEKGDIPVIALQTAVNRLGGQVDLAKIDCEGAEWEMFSVIEPWRNIQRLAMEYHLVNGESHQQLSDTIQKLGFRILAQEPATDFGMVWAVRD